MSRRTESLTLKPIETGYVVSMYNKDYHNVEWAFTSLDAALAHIKSNPPLIVEENDPVAPTAAARD